MTSLIFCVEPGVLYSQAVLLAESVNRYTASFFNQMYAFSPRQNHHPNPVEKQKLKQLGLTVIDEPLNTQYLGIPIANKILACSWSEQNLADEQLLMVDTDTIFLRPPEALTAAGVDVFLRPVDRPGQASLGPGSTHENYWQKAHQLCQIPAPEERVKTGVNLVPIRPYFNAGFVAYRRQLNLSDSWLQLLDTLRSHDHHPNNPRCLDQVTLAIATTDWSREVLPHTYNYPLPLRSRMEDPAMQKLQLDDLVHVHYHRWFQKPGFLDLLNPKLLPSEPLDWLYTRLPIEPLLDDHFPH